MAAPSDELRAALVRRALRAEGAAVEACRVAAEGSPPLAVPPPPPPLEASSRWTPDRIRVAMASIPAATAYPDLVRRAGDVLEKWYYRFPLNVWSRFVKFADSGTGRHKQLPKVVKEFNESAPILARLMEWTDQAERAGDPHCDIVDLCSGFGFLAMFASELLPVERVQNIYLVDRVWPNRNVPGSKGGGITTAHIYDHGEWPIPLLTLQVDVKKSREMRDLAKHIVRDPRPTIICGVHLCGTLSLRAIQLFNDGLSSGCGVTGLIFAPCCLPRKQHRDRKFVYEVGAHRFTAQELHDHKAKNGLNAYEVYQEHLLLCIDAPDKAREEMGALGGDDDERHRDQRNKDKNVFFFARAPYRHDGSTAGLGFDFGKPVVIDGLRLN